MSDLFARRVMRLTLLLFLVLFAGCGIPVSRTMIVPKDVAQSPEHLIAKLDLLKTGMEMGEVFELLDVKRTTPGVREIVNAEENKECCMAPHSWSDLPKNSNNSGVT